MQPTREGEIGGTVRILGVVVALVVLLVGAGLAAQRLSDGPLAGPIPGGPFRTGTLVTEPVEDWSFAHGQPAELQLVNPPGSRQLGTMVHEGELYVPCDLGFIADRAPEGRLAGALLKNLKGWHEDAATDGRVLLRISGKLYERQAVRVTDPAVLAALRASIEELAKEFFGKPLLDQPTDPDDIWFFRMDPRS